MSLEQIANEVGMSSKGAVSNALRRLSGESPDASEDW
jgi:hypothetical protein